MTDTKSMASNRPQYAAFINQGEEGKPNKLVKVGAVWVNKKGTGFNLILDEETTVSRLFILPFKQ